MKNRLKELQRFDEANYLMAKRAIENPQQYPHLRKWARLVMLRLGEHFQRSIADAKKGLALMNKAEGK